MPTATELVPNKGLTGEEVKAILRKDFERLLQGEGSLLPYIAYPRIAWDITLKLHFDNPMSPTSEIKMQSRSESVAAIIENPKLAAIQSMLAGAKAIGKKFTRVIESPNEERLRHGIPVPVDVRQPDRTVTTEMVKYPADPSFGDGDIRIEDIEA